MTAQVREILKIRDKTYSMACTPDLPYDDELIALQENEIKKNYYGTSMCHRRYQGVWELRDDKFYLVRINGKFKLTSRKPVFAEWFTGELKIPQGKLLRYFHLDFFSLYEKEIQIEIEKGIVKS